MRTVNPVEDYQLRANNKLINFDQFKKALEKVAIEDNNQILATMKKQWIQNKKKYDQLSKKAKQSERDVAILETHKESLNQDKQIFAILKKKPQLDIIREYLVHLGLDDKKGYLAKITVLQPFQIRDTSSRMVAQYQTAPLKKKIVFKAKDLLKRK